MKSSATLGETCDKVRGLGCVAPEAGPLERNGERRSSFVSGAAPRGPNRARAKVPRLASFFITLALMTLVGCGAGTARIHVDLRGNRRVPRAALTAALMDLEEVQEPRLALLAYAIDELVPSALEKIQLAYADLGYLRAQVTLVRAVPEPESNTARVLLQIEEGPRFRVRFLRQVVETFVGDSPPTRPREIRVRGLEPGVWFSRERIVRYAEELVKHHANRGHLLARTEFEITLDLEQNEVEILVRSVPGARMKLAGVQVWASSGERPDLARRLRLGVGERITERAVEGAQAALEAHLGRPVHVARTSVPHHPEWVLLRFGVVAE